MKKRECWQRGCMKKYNAWTHILAILLLKGSRWIVSRIRKCRHLQMSCSGDAVDCKTCTTPTTLYHVCLLIKTKLWGYLDVKPSTSWEISSYRTSTCQSQFISLRDRDSAEHSVGPLSFAWCLLWVMDLCYDWFNVHSGLLACCISKLASLLLPRKKKNPPCRWARPATSAIICINFC